MTNYLYNSIAELREINSKRFIRFAYRTAFHNEPSSGAIEACCALLNSRKVDHIQLIRKLRQDAELSVVNNIDNNANSVLDIDTLISKIRNEISSRSQTICTK